MARQTTRVKAPAAAHPVPQSREQAIAAIAEIGRRQRERARIQAKMNDRLAVIREEFERQAAPHADAIRGLSAGVQTWCEANRDALTDGGKVKTASLASGEVRWRMTPPKVSVRAIDVVLDLLRSRGLTRFIRTKEELARDAILAEPEAVDGIPGIRIEQREEFVVIPFETDLEEVA